MNPPDESLLSQRRQGLARWRSEMDEFVVELGQLFQFDPPTQLRDDPVQALPFLRHLTAEDLSARSERDIAWIATRLMALLGQLLIRDDGAEWTVEDDSTSPAYARYVLRRPTGHMLDLGEFVREFLAEPAGRDLLDLVARAEAGLGKG